MQTFGGSRRGAGFEPLPPSLFCAKAVLLREARSRDLTLAPLLPQNLQFTKFKEFIKYTDISRSIPNLDNQSRADLFSYPAEEKGKSWGYRYYWWTTLTHYGRSSAWIESPRAVEKMLKTNYLLQLVTETLRKRIPGKSKDLPFLPFLHRLVLAPSPEGNFQTKTSFGSIVAKKDQILLFCQLDVLCILDLGSFLLEYCYLIPRCLCIMDKEVHL